MKPTPLITAMREKQLSLGLYFLNSSPELMEIAGYAGYNHAIIDHMFTAVDWSLTAHMVRAGQLFGVSSIVRVQTYPWGSAGQDTRVAAEVARALGIGASGAMLSIGSVKELEMALRVQRDFMHSRIHVAPALSPEGAGSTGVGEDFLVVPLIELPSLMDEIEDIVALKGLTAIAIAMGDMCTSLGHADDQDHPDVWRMLDQAVRAAEPYGISVWANNWRYFATEDIVGSVQRFWDHGIRTVQVHCPEFLLQYALKEIAVGVAKRLGGP